MDDSDKGEPVSTPREAAEAVLHAARPQGTVEQWRKQQADAHQEASEAALRAAKQVDPEADMQPRPYYVEGFGFTGTADAARVYFDVYDSVLLRSISRHKATRKT